MVVTTLVNVTIIHTLGFRPLQKIEDSASKAFRNGRVPLGCDFMGYFYFESALVSTILRKDNGDGSNQDLNIKPQTLAFNVRNVQA